MKKEKANKIVEILNNKYSNPTPSLDFTNNFEFLIAVILSAQCTDERVNKTTPMLFPKYNSPDKLLKLGIESLSQIIRPCGCFNTKAKNIITTCQMLIDKHNGEVPATMEELTELAGVGRKTASVILSQAFGIPAFPVDTHILRVSNRLGLAKSKTPLGTERQVCSLIDKKHWTFFHLQLIFHGRETCKARSPKCNNCELYDLCEWKSKTK